MVEKFCVNCRHCRRDECKAPQNRIDDRDIVTGEIIRPWRWNFCCVQRIDGWLAARVSKTCGKEGRWFVPRDAEVRS